MFFFICHLFSCCCLDLLPNRLSRAMTGSRLYVFLIIWSALCFIMWLHMNPDVLFWYALGRLHGLGRGSMFLVSEFRYRNGNLHDTTKWIFWRLGDMFVCTVPSAVACRSSELCCSVFLVYLKLNNIFSDINNNFYNVRHGIWSLVYISLCDTYTVFRHASLQGSQLIYYTYKNLIFNENYFINQL
jgi:hypothetical protein